MSDLQNKLNNFKNNIIKNYKQNDKHLIYLRLSALDYDQKDAEEDALNKLNSDFNSLIIKYPQLKEKGFTLFVEVKSAYKNSTREEFVKLYENYLFKDVTLSNILEQTFLLYDTHLYVSSYDRLSRVFFHSLQFLLICKVLKIQIHSLNDKENELEEESKDIIYSESENQLIYLFRLILISQSASKHSTDMSYKIKKRVSKDDAGNTTSNKTNKKWGRKKQIPIKVEERIKHYKSLGYTNAFISIQKDIYKLDTNNKKVKLSESAIKKIK